jgi:hypothetical protein
LSPGVKTMSNILVNLAGVRCRSLLNVPIHYQVQWQFRSSDRIGH